MVADSHQPKDHNKQSVSHLKLEQGLSFGAKHIPVTYNCRGLFLTARYSAALLLFALHSVLPC